MIYGLKNSYATGVPVSPADLNRRADIIQAQLPGAFKGLGAGVFELDDLLVNAPARDVVSPGDALILNSDGVLVYVSVPTALSIPPRTTQTYLHLALRVPAGIGGPEDTAGTDSRRGAAPVLLLSEDDDETDALRLAHWNGTAWQDARPFSLAARVGQLNGDLGYDATERAKGSVAARLNALLDIDDGPIGEVSRAEFNAFKADVTQRLAALEAQQAALVKGNDNFPTPLDQAFDEIAINRVGLAEVNAHAIERGQISVITVNAGHGQDDTPDYSPNTGADNELAFNVVDGTFGS